MDFFNFEVWQLPTLNAVLNAISAFFLVLAFLFIRKKQVSRHKISIVLALISSTLFLISYLIYHFNVGHVPYGGVGTMRTLYFVILITHTLLAAAVLPMIAITIPLALKKSPKHPFFGRITLSIWLYVSITGVVVFLMLRPYAMKHYQQLSNQSIINQTLIIATAEEK